MAAPNSRISANDSQRSFTRLVVVGFIVSCLVLMVLKRTIVEYELPTKLEADHTVKSQDIPPAKSSNFHKCHVIFPSETAVTPEILTPYSKLHLGNFSFGNQSDPLSEFGRRAEKMKHNCGSLSNQIVDWQDPVTTSRIAFYEKTGVFYCSINKVVSSSWSAALSMMESGKVSRLTDKQKSMGVAGLMPFSARYTLPQILKRARQGRGSGEFDARQFFAQLNAAANISVIPTRHPISRFLSGYRDLALGKHPNAHIEGMPEVWAAVDAAHDPSTGKYPGLLDTYTRFALGSRDRRHYRTYHQSCLPCHFTYHAVVRMDHPDQFDLFFHNAPLDQKFKQLYNNIPQSMKLLNPSASHRVSWQQEIEDLDPQLLIQFLHRYEGDFRIFDYKLYKCE